MGINSILTYLKKVCSLKYCRSDRNFPLHHLKYSNFYSFSIIATFMMKFFRSTMFYQMIRDTENFYFSIIIMGIHEFKNC